MHEDAFCPRISYTNIHIVRDEDVGIATLSHAIDMI